MNDDAKVKAILLGKNFLRTPEAVEALKNYVLAPDSCRNGLHSRDFRQACNYFSALLKVEGIESEVDDLCERLVKKYPEIRYRGAHENVTREYKSLYIPAQQTKGKPKRKPKP